MTLLRFFKEKNATWKSEGDTLNVYVDNKIVASSEKADFEEIALQLNVEYNEAELPYLLV